MTDETATLSLAPSLDPPCSLFAFALSLARSILFPISHQLCFAFSLAFSSPFFRRMHLFARTHTILPTTNEMERKGGKGKGIEASSLSLSLSGCCNETFVPRVPHPTVFRRGCVPSNASASFGQPSLTFDVSRRTTYQSGSFNRPRES